MPRVSAAFFAFGALCLLVGMCAGMAMGGSENFTLAPVHAHLNLLGWVTMAIYGTFYALTKNTMSVRLAWINFCLSVVGVLVMMPAMAILLLHNDQRLNPVVGIGGLINMLALIVFGISVVRELRRAPV